MLKKDALFLLLGFFFLFMFVIGSRQKDFSVENNWCNPTDQEMWEGKDSQEMDPGFPRDEEHRVFTFRPDSFVRHRQDQYREGTPLKRMVGMPDSGHVHHRVVHNIPGPRKDVR
jgi:hypothetical protein